MKPMIKVLLKLALTGGAISAIWLLAFTQDPQEPIGEVKPAVADIGFLSGKDGNEFTRAMASVGLKPRPYDLNGNVMYFAAGTTDKSPAEIEAIINDALVEHGVNSKDRSKEPPATGAMANWEFPTNPDNAKGNWEAFQRNVQRSKPDTQAMMDGEVVTTVREPNFVRMVGVDWNETPEQLLERAKNHELDRSEQAPKSFMGGYKFVEAMYDRATGETEISAVWTAKGFEPRKMDNTAFIQQEADPNVPACIGCTRDFRMQSLDKSEPIRSNKWHTLSSPSKTYDFYVRAMTARGWKESGVQPILDRAGEIVPELGNIEGRILNLEKDDQTMQLVLIPDGKGGTEIFSTERYAGANSILKGR